MMPNQAHSVGAPIASLFAFERQSRRAPDAQRWTESRDPSHA